MNDLCPTYGTYGDNSSGKLLVITFYVIEEGANVRFVM